MQMFSTARILMEKTLFVPITALVWIQMQWWWAEQHWYWPQQWLQLALQWWQGTCWDLFWGQGQF
jgi:hypothetical protein